MGFYDDVKLEADTLLEEFGQPITISRYTVTNNIVTGTVSRVLASEQTLNAASIPATQASMQGFDIRQMPEVMTDANVNLVIVSAQGATFVPSTKDSATLNSIEYDIVGVTPLNVNGTDVIYTIGLRNP